MESFGRYIAENLPWLEPVLAWSVGVLLLLAVLSIPSFYVVFPIARSLRQALDKYLSNLLKRHSDHREDRQRLMDKLVEEFRQTSRMSWLPGQSSHPQSAFKKFAVVADKLIAKLKSLSHLSRLAEQMAKQLSEISTPSASHLPEIPIPPVGQIQFQHGSLRTAKVRVVVSSVILLALMAVNTGMLGQILRELGFIPQDLNLLGVPLYLLFAFFLTLLEAGLGYVHTASGPTSEDPKRIAVWPIVAICFALIIACVEGFFYSQVAPSKDALVDLPIGFQIKQGTLFFLWGATLVLVLFGLGRIWSRSLEEITKSAGDLQGVFRRCRQELDRLAITCERVDASMKSARHEVSAVRQALQDGENQVKEISASVESLKGAVSDLTPTDAQPRELSHPDIHHFIHTSGWWFLLTFFGALVLAGTAFFAVGHSFPNLSALVLIFASFGIAVAYLILGLVIPHGELIMERVGNRQIVVSGSLWRSRIAVTLAAFMVITFVVLLWRFSSSGNLIALWVLVFLLGGFLAVAISQCAATGKGLRLWFRSFGNVAHAFIEALGRLCIRIVFGVVLLLELLSLALASPIFLMRDRRLPDWQ